MSGFENTRAWWKKLNAPTQALLAGAFSLLAGMMVAVVFHYVLYRIGLPSQPFIYVAF